MEYIRITLKLSGEAFGFADGDFYDRSLLSSLIQQLKALRAHNIAISIVPGGGNIFRGRDLGAVLPDLGVSHISADHIGMLATVMNALVLRDALVHAGIPTTVFTPHAIHGLTDGYSRHRALAALASFEVVICAGGTGNPLVTTDTAAALRAVELSAEVLIKASNVDGVYESDPSENPDAHKFDQLSFTEVLHRDLKVMDNVAFRMCQDHQIPIILYNHNTENALGKIVNGESVGTLIYNSTERSRR